MRLLLVHAHPVPDSLAGDLCRAVFAAAAARGHELRLIDLYAAGFDPVMGAQERRDYDSPDKIPADIAPHIADLRWAEGLIFVYPTWWSGVPAILKGWLDRVWRPGVAFVPGVPLGPGLPNIRLIGVVTTLGAPWWVWTFLLGAPGRKALLRGLRFCTAKRTRTFWLALHSIDRASAPERQGFVQRVKSRIARLPI